MHAIVRFALALPLLALTVLLAGRVLLVDAGLPPWLHDPVVYFPTVGYLLVGIPMAVACAIRRAAVPILPTAAIAALAANLVADFRPPTLFEKCTSYPHRLLSYNIYQARWGDDEIAAFVIGERPHVLVMQEVPPWWHSKHHDELLTAFGHVEYHNSLLVATRLPVLDVSRTDLSHGRSLLGVAVEVEGRRVDVFNTHLSVANPDDFFERLAEQRTQTGEVLARMDNAPGRVVIAGDFNVPVGSTCYRRFAARYTNARAEVGVGFGYTFNTFLPLTTIDHCFASRGVQFTRWEPLPVTLSDHRPVRVDFTAIERTDMADTR